MFYDKIKADQMRAGSFYATFFAQRMKMLGNKEVPPDERKMYHSLKNQLTYCTRRTAPQMRAIVSIIVALSIICSAYAGFGNDLIHSAGAQEYLPITSIQAYANGWVESTQNCRSSIGQAWNKKVPYPTPDYPITLYYGSNQQISGIGTEVFGDVPVNWYLKGYYTYQKLSKHESFHIEVAFRSNETDLCTVVNRFPETIGDRVVINPDGVSHRVPANYDDAYDQRWTNGACINGMGVHCAYDLVTSPFISYNISNLVPVVPMYHPSTLELNAIFFLSKSVQQGLLSHNQWDVIPINGYLMCKNFCGDCRWSNLDMFSTMHIWFGTTQINNCGKGCN